MKTIIVISPHYLEAVFKEAKKHNFAIQGYGKFSLACKGVLFINSSELLGVSFIGDKLPKVQSGEFKKLIEFLDLLSNMQKKIKFTIVTKEDIPIGYSKIFKQHQNIEFYGRTGLEYITDTVISQNVFGSILLANKKPYKFQESKEEDVKHYSLPSVTVDNLISPYLLQCISTVNICEDYNTTVAYDSVCLQYRNDKNEALVCMREYVIGYYFHNNDDATLEIAYKYISKLTGTSYINLLVLLEYVRREYSAKN